MNDKELLQSVIRLLDCVEEDMYICFNMKDQDGVLACYKAFKNVIENDVIPQCEYIPTAAECMKAVRVVYRLALSLVMSL